MTHAKACGWKKFFELVIYIQWNWSWLILSLKVFFGTTLISFFSISGSKFHLVALHDAGQAYNLTYYDQGKFQWRGTLFMLWEVKNLKELLQGVGVFCRRSTDRYSNFVPEICFPTPSSWSRKILLSEKNVCYGIIRRALSWNSIRTEISHVLSLNFKIFLIIWWSVPFYCTHITISVNHPHEEEIDEVLEKNYD